MPVSLKDKTVKQKQNLSVYYEKSTTKNLGNFESVKVTVGVTIPAHPTKEDIAAIEHAISVADGLVTEELVTQLDELKDK